MKRANRRVAEARAEAEVKKVAEVEEDYAPNTVYSTTATTNISYSDGTKPEPNVGMETVPEAIVFSLSTKVELFYFINALKKWKSYIINDMNGTPPKEFPLQEIILRGRRSTIKLIDRNLEKLKTINLRSLSDYKNDSDFDMSYFFRFNRPYIVMNKFNWEIIDIIYKVGKVSRNIDLNHFSLFLSWIKDVIVFDKYIKIERLEYVGHIEEILYFMEESIGININPDLPEVNFDSNKKGNRREKDTIEINGEKYPVSIIEEITEGNIDDFYQALEWGNIPND